MHTVRRQFVDEFVGMFGEGESCLTIKVEKPAEDVVEIQKECRCDALHAAPGESVAWSRCLSGHSHALSMPASIEPRVDPCRSGSILSLTASTLQSTWRWSRGSSPSTI